MGKWRTISTGAGFDSAESVGKRTSNLSQSSFGRIVINSHELSVESDHASDDVKDIPALFRQEYRGSRYSFGYPACPNLEDQTKLFRLLDPSRIGVSLTEEFQLVPEQSTSAIVVHHPSAKYFNV